MNPLPVLWNLKTMNNLQAILTDISVLTKTIETDYPELYRFLDENPMTIPSMHHPHINSDIMHEYLESLKMLLKHHLKTHKNPTAV